MKLTRKERFIYKFIFNEKRVYRHWYSRFLITNVNIDRIRRVISRINHFYDWCKEWQKEGDALSKIAGDALAKGNNYSAYELYQEAAACCHIGQHPYFLDLDQKQEVQEKVRIFYQKSIELLDEAKRPIRIEIPYLQTVIPGYLHRTDQPNQPLIIQVNGMDNLKEIENHYLGIRFVENGFNTFVFDGPGQGEMWNKLKLIKDYEKVVSVIIDWFEKNNQFKINLEKIAIYGMSFGGYLSPRVAAFEKRISCAVGNGGFGYLQIGKKKENPLTINLKRVNPIYIRGLLYMTGYKSINEFTKIWDKLDIKEVPPLDRPFLFIQGGKDRVIPNATLQAKYLMEWAIGEKKLLYYPNGEHCCANYLDEVIPFSIDWLSKYLYEV